MFSSFRLVAALGLLASFLMSSGEQASAQVTPPPATPSKADPLLSLNNASRAFYTRAKATALEHHGPVIIVSGDDLILRKGSTRTQVRVIPEIYHTLKAVAHVPMAIDVALAAHTQDPFQNDSERSPFEEPEKPKPEPPLPDDLVQELRDYRALLPAAEARVVTAGLNPEQRERQKAILAACKAFLDSVIAKKQCTTDERTSFTRKMNPPVMANAADAARAALDAIHLQVTEWKKQMKPEEWNRLSVLVIGRQLPRRENLAVQYFERLLEESDEGQRIIYAEGLAEEPRALDLLATHLVDTRIAEDFFNDSKRMNRDLLADAARDYLPILLDGHQTLRLPSPLTR